MIDFFDIAIDGAKWFARILWAVRVSVLNAVSSVILFWFAVPAQNLMADLSFRHSPPRVILFWFGVFFMTFVFWAFPLHYGARKTLDEESWIIARNVRDALSGIGRTRVVDTVRKDYAFLIAWVPRALGVVPFVALAIGIHFARAAVEGATILDESKETLDLGERLYVADGVTAVLFVAFVYVRRRPFMRVLLGPFFDRPRLFHGIALVGTAAIYASAYFFPLWSSSLFPRALLVPPLFGSLVLLFSWLQRIGNRTGVPVLTLFCAVAAALTGLNVTFSDLRVLETRRPDQRVSIEKAIRLWRHANGCETTDCPRPIIVAIDGGASRAAFTAATFVGAFLDAMPPAKPGEAATPGRRIFAISGVSGGSLGAAVIQAAIADAQDLKLADKPPCRRPESTWFGYANWSDARHGLTWRQCLQALASGDYLSPAIIGLAFRDFAAPPWQLLGPRAMNDRAALLEQSWERHYTTILGSGERCDTDAVVAAPQGLCRLAAHPLAFFDTPDQAPRWMPMLLLNGTSVATGRRIISSDFVSRPGAGNALYPQAYDLREAMSCPIDTDSTDCRGEAADSHPDIRLSTAAMMSARFPIVSPAGAFVSRGTKLGDQIVDGGYFENSGLSSALDIVKALKAHDMRPIVVSISNDPKDHPPEKAAKDMSPPRQTVTPIVPRADLGFLGRVLGLLSRPIEAVLATDQGHAAEAMERVRKAVGPDGFFRLAVASTLDFPANASGSADPEGCASLAARPKPKLDKPAVIMPKVSMSWWLSYAVQADLDAQRCSQDNIKALGDLIGPPPERFTTGAQPK